MHRLLIPLALALVLLAPRPAQAQVTTILAGLFKSINSVSFSGGGGGFLGGSDAVAACGALGVCHLHLEVLLDLPAPEGVTLELGLGTDVLRGFALAEPSIDFRGSARSLPLISAYASSDRLPGGAVAVPYGGLRAGFSQLWNARAYDAEGIPYRVEGEAFEVGAVAGLYLVAAPLRGLYLEAALHQRQFDALAWGLSGDGRLPQGWPRALNLSTWQVALGWQFRLD